MENSIRTELDPAMADKGYARPDALVSTAWLAERFDDPGIRVLESNEDPTLFDRGHIPGAQQLNWHRDLNDPVVRDYIDRDRFQALLRRLGIDETTTVVLYGDKSNWWAAYSFWVFQLFGFENARLLDGGRAKWLAEGRGLVTSASTYEPSEYDAPERRDERVRAFFSDVLTHTRVGHPLIDVRSPEEYAGTKLHMPDYPQEGALRGGHVPGARNVPWARAAADDGSFKPVDALREIYEGGAGLRAEDDVITYCRIGERSSHTWFVLRYLLGFDNVRNYDGSWTEWGNTVRAPIER